MGAPIPPAQLRRVEHGISRSFNLLESYAYDATSKLVIPGGIHLELGCDRAVGAYHRLLKAVLYLESAQYVIARITVQKASHLRLNISLSIQRMNASIMTVSPKPGPQVRLIELTAEELSTRKIGSHNLQAAVEALHQDGIVVLKNAVDPAHLDQLNARMVPEAKELYARPSTHRNFGNSTGNIQQEPVLEEGYLFEDVIANPWATEVIQCMLGPKPTLRFYSANTAFKAEGRQPPHIDIDFDFPKLPFGYCVNINLVDTSPENGATEVWLGSHHDTDKSVLDSSVKHKQIKAELREARRKFSPPIQPSLPKGSLIIRDFRLWHAGMPNRTDEPRVMLVSVQFPHWYRSDLKIKLPKSVDGKIQWGDITPCVDWKEEDYDYLQGAHDHDFTLQP